MDMQLLGIILRKTPVKQHHSVVTLFTPLGLMPVFVKANFPLYPIPSVAQYTFSYEPPKLRVLLQEEDIQPFFDKKISKEQQMAFHKMSQAILKSQWEEYPAPNLFTLFLDFLRNMSRCSNPHLFSSIFLWKLLQHEGVIDLFSTCSFCKEPIHTTTFYRYEGEKYCLEHAPKKAILFDANEEKLLLALTKTQRIEDFLHLSQLHLDLSDKITLLFETLHPTVISGEDPLTEDDRSPVTAVNMKRESHGSFSY